MSGKYSPLELDLAFQILVLFVFTFHVLAVGNPFSLILLAFLGVYDLMSNLLKVLHPKPKLIIHLKIYFGVVSFFFCLLILFKSFIRELLMPAVIISCLLAIYSVYISWKFYRLEVCHN